MLPDMEKTGGVAGYLYKAPDGLMYAAGKSYFIQFDPNRVVASKTEPTVHFTGFEIFNQSFNNLLLQQTIKLKYKQNYFTVEFAAPDFSSGTPVQYAYKLEGFNTDWIATGTRNFVSFSNLEGGTYTLRVRATNTPGVWSKHEAAIRIRVIPPFWKRWWFFILCAAVVAGSVYALYRYRVNEIIKRQAMRNKIASDLHDNIGSTLSSISVYSQVAEIQNKKQNAPALEDVLQKIGNASTEMISEMNDIVWAINPRNDSMEKMIDRMESYAKPLLAAKNISFEFTCSEDLLKSNLKMEKRKNMYLVFKEAVNNALKYSGCTRLNVVISNTRNQLQMTISDNGMGFDTGLESQKKGGSLGGNGLKNMTMRALEMKGNVYITSSPGNGTTINLVCPMA
jgi:signal transduction histidine kinase